MRVEIFGSTGISGIILETINKKHTIIDTGVIKQSDSTVSFKKDTSDNTALNNGEYAIHDRDGFIIRLEGVCTSTNNAGSGGTQIILFNRKTI